MLLAERYPDDEQDIFYYEAITIVTLLELHTQLEEHKH